MASRPRVHLLAGLNGSGKTTLARQLELGLPAVRFTLDEWMLRLHHLRYDEPGYPAAAASCRDLIWDTAVQVLRCGVDVVLDWNLWSRERRSEWAAKAAAVDVTCVLHVLDTSLQEATRRAGTRTDPVAHRLTPADISHLAGLFEPPTGDEGIILDVVKGPDVSLG